jgi:hypothetical protein
MLKHAKHVYPFNTPLTKEAYYYRMIFEKHFPQVSTMPLSLNSSSLLEFFDLLENFFCTNLAFALRSNLHG